MATVTLQGQLFSEGNTRTMPDVPRAARKQFPNMESPVARGSRPHLWGMKPPKPQAIRGQRLPSVPKDTLWTRFPKATHGSITYVPRAAGKQLPLTESPLARSHHLYGESDRLDRKRFTGQR